MKAHVKIGGIVAAFCTAAVALPVFAHHSFSIFDAEQTKTFTGVVTRVNPDANHLQILFAPMNEERKNVERTADGKPVVWAVEMAGSAQSAKDGISVNSFPPGTIFTVSLHPLRNGDPAGARGFPLGRGYKACGQMAVSAAQLGPLAAGMKAVAAARRESAAGRQCEQ